MKGAIPFSTSRSIRLNLTLSLNSILLNSKKLQRNEQGVEKGTAPFMHGVTSVRFKF